MLQRKTLKKIHKSDNFSVSDCQIFNQMIQRCQFPQEIVQLWIRIAAFDHARVKVLRTG